MRGDFSIVCRCLGLDVCGEVEEGRLIAQLKKESAPRVTLADTCPGVGHNLSSVISHFRWSAILPAEVSRDRIISGCNGLEDGTVTDGIKGVSKVDCNDRLLR